MKLPKFFKFTTQSDMLRIKMGAIVAGAPAPLILTGPIFGFNIFIFRDNPQEQHEKTSRNAPKKHFGKSSTKNTKKTSSNREKTKGN